jgi:hypothetical protein
LKLLFPAGRVFHVGSGDHLRILPVLVVGRGPEPGRTVLVLFATLTHAAERQLDVADIHDRIFDAAYTERCFAQHLLLGRRALGEEVPIACS